MWWLLAERCPRFLKIMNLSFTHTSSFYKKALNMLSSADCKIWVCIILIKWMWQYLIHLHWPSVADKHWMTWIMSHWIASRWVISMTVFQHPCAFLLRLKFSYIIISSRNRTKAKCDPTLTEHCWTKHNRETLQHINTEEQRRWRGRRCWANETNAGQIQGTRTETLFLFLD